MPKEVSRLAGAISTNPLSGRHRNLGERHSTKTVLRTLFVSAGLAGGLLSCVTSTSGEKSLLSPTATTSDGYLVVRGWPQLPVGFVPGTTAVLASAEMESFAFSIEQAVSGPIHFYTSA